MLGADRPAGLMQGYQGDDGKLSGADGDLYRSGDVVFADDEGYLTFVGRSDDVFKSSDYRISPFELESVLLEHECGRGGRGGAEPRSDPARDPEGLCAAGGGRRAFAGNRAVDLQASAHAAGAVQAHPARSSSSTELPKTISGKIRRVQLRRLEHDNNRDDALRGQEFREEDFPELQKVRTAGSES